MWAILRRLDLLSVLQALYARASIGASFGEVAVTGGFVVGMICANTVRSDDASVQMFQSSHGLWDNKNEWV